MAKRMSAKSVREFDDSDVQEFAEAILEEHDKLASEKGAYMKRCGTIRERIDGHYDEAEEKGIPRKALRKNVKRLLLQRQIAKIPADLEGQDAKDYAHVAEALGDFADTGLGAAALRAAKNGGKTAEAHGTA
jgi:hypothetical protein